MEIVILDAKTLGNDIDLSLFEQFGNLTVYQTTAANKIKRRIASAEIIITNKVVIGPDEFVQAPLLKLICVAATGYNNIDINFASKQGVVVANVKNYSTESVAQHTFSLILALENSLIDYANDTKARKWSKSTVFTMLDHPFYELAGKKFGIIGYGNIGKRVAEIARVFGMEVLVGKRPGVKYKDKERVNFKTVLAEADVISIHTPLSDNTLNMFTINEFKTMKSTAILINVARGGIVNEEDLFMALEYGIIRAAAIDVCENEPIESTSRLPKLKNMLITPHIAWASLESRKRLLAGIENNIKMYLSGNTGLINLAGK